MFEIYVNWQFHNHFSSGSKPSNGVILLPSPTPSLHPPSAGMFVPANDYPCWTTRKYCRRNWDKNFITCVRCLPGGKARLKSIDLSCFAAIIRNYHHTASDASSACSPYADESRSDVVQTFDKLASTLMPTKRGLNGAVIFPPLSPVKEEKTRPYRGHVFASRYIKF